MKLFSRVLSVVLCTASTLFSAEYFVATTGLDTNPGTSAQPVATLQRAMNLAKLPGDIITVRSGTYYQVGNNRFTASGTEAAPITLRGEPGGTVVLKGSRLVTGWQAHSGAIYRVPWTNYYGSWSSVYSDGDPANDPGYRGNGKGRNQFFVNGALLEEVPTYAFLKPGSFYIDPTTDVAYVWLADGSNPSAHVMEGTVMSDALIATWGRHYLVIRDLTLMHSAVPVAGAGLIRVSGPYGGYTGAASTYVTLDNVKCLWSAGAGLAIHGSYHIVRNSEFNDNGWDGMQISGAHYGLFENIKNLRNNTHAGKTFETGWESSLKIAGTRYAVFDRIESAYNVGQGFWIDGPGNAFNTLKNSLIHHNTHEGVRLEISYATTVFNNLIYENGEHGIDVSASIGNKIFNNTIYRNKNMAIGVGDSRTWTEGYKMTSYSNVVMNNIAIDNQLRDTNAKSWLVERAPEDVTDILPQGYGSIPYIPYDANISDNNVFYLSPAFPHFTVYGPPVFFAGYADLDDYQIKTGLDLGSVYIDPQMVNLAAGNVRLTAASPVRARGANAVLETVPVDHEGNLRIESWVDPGAFQLPPGEGWLSMAPNADASVLNGTQASTNYGGSTTLLPENKGGTYRKVYMRFPANFRASDAVFEFTTQDWATTNAVPFRLYGLNDGAAGDAPTGWLESGTGGITYNNAPGNSLSSPYFSSSSTTLLDGFLVQLATTGGTTNEKIYFRSAGLRNFLNLNRNGSATVMLVRESSSTQTPYDYNANTRIYSKEGLSGPKLIYRKGGVEPLEDTYAAEFSPTNNYGNSVFLRSRARGTPGVNIQSFLKFSVAGLPNASTAKLRLVVAKPYGGTRPAAPTTMNIYKVESDAWSESSMTYASGRPALGALLGQISVTHPGQTVTLNISSAVLAEAAGDGILSLAIIQPSSVNKDIYFHSSEALSDLVRPLIFTE